MIQKFDLNEEVGRLVKKSEMCDPRAGTWVTKVETGDMKVGKIGEEDPDA